MCLAADLEYASPWLNATAPVDIDNLAVSIDCSVDVSPGACDLT